MSKSVFYRYAEFTVRRRAWVFSLVALITLFLASRIAGLKIDMDPDIWAPQAHPYVKTTKVLEEIFGGRNVVLIGVLPKDGNALEPSVLAKVQRIQRGIERMPEAVRHNVISLAARQVKDIKGTPDGMEVRRMLDVLPQSPADVARLKAAVAANPVYINALVSADGEAVAIIADFKMGRDPSYAALYQSIQDIVAQERDTGVDIFMSGLPVDLASAELHTTKMPIYFAIALLIILAIQYWSFRSIQGMLLPVITAVLSVVWALGMMGWFDVHMDVMNATTPILIMAMAAGHAIQILKRYYEEYARLSREQPGLDPARLSAAAVVESLAKVGPVMLAAGIIAMITFYSLAAAGMSVVRHFGIFAGTGVLAALILEMTLIPALRSRLRAPRITGHDHVLEGLTRTVSRYLADGRATWILFAAGALVLLALAGVLRLTADNSLKHYNAEDSQIRREDAALNAKFGGTNSLFLMVEGSGVDAIKDPAVLQAMARLQRFLEAQPHVGKTQSLADLVARMHSSMHADDPAYRAIPDDANLVAQYLLLYATSGDPQDFDNFVDNAYQRAVIWVYIKEDSTAHADALYARARAVIDREFPPGVSVRMGGSLAQSIAINDTLTSEKFVNMLQMAMVVFLLASLVLRSVVGGLFVVVPVALIIVFNFGLMGWLGIPLDMGTATTASMAIGIGADYEIYLLFRFREELTRAGGNVARAMAESLRTSGKAVLFVALSVAGGYSVLLLSDFAFYTRLAALVMATMLVSAISALLIQRSMIVVFRPGFLFGATPYVATCKVA